jgi:hypothetical protein
MPGQRWPMVGSVVSLVLLLLIAGTGAFEAAPRPGAFALGILRRDGMLMPFGAFDGKHWRNVWPVPGQSVNMPIVTADIPKGWWPDKQPLMDWTLVPIGAKNTPTASTVRVTGINWFLAGCQQAVGLRTDYKPAILPPPPRVHPYPKDALAVSGDVRIDPIELVAPTDKVAQMFTAMLSEAVIRREEVAVARLTTSGWTHSYTQPEREKTPVQLEALYRVRQGADGRDLHYFEAVKRYFLPKDPTVDLKALVPRAKQTQKLEQSCDLITFAWGWFTTKPEGRVDNLLTKVLITSCDYKNARFMLPLGTVTINDEHLWIVQWSNPTSESYMVIDPKTVLEEGHKNEPLLVVNGGSCEKTEN